MEETKQRIIELKEELDNLPSATKPFDMREKILKKNYPNNKKGELLQYLDETKDAYQRTEIIKQLKELIESEIKAINDYINELNAYKTQEAYIEKLKEDVNEPGLDSNERTNIWQEINELEKNLRQPEKPDSLNTTNKQTEERVNNEDDKSKKTKEDDYNENDEYARALEIYKSDMEKLYELQDDYEKGKISYKEYEEYASYMIGREKFMQNWYNKLNKNTSTDKNPYVELTDQELQKQLDELNEEYLNEYQYRAHGENGMESHENDFLKKLEKKIQDIKNELTKRKDDKALKEYEDLLKKPGVKVNEDGTIEVEEDEDRILMMKYAEEIKSGKYELIYKDGVEDYGDNTATIAKLIYKKPQIHKQNVTIEKPEYCMFIKETLQKKIEELEPKSLIGLRQEILNLQGDDIVTDKQAKRYANSIAKWWNYKGSEGKLFHNIARGTMATIGFIPAFAKKIFGKLTTRKSTTIKMKNIKARVDNLSEEQIISLKDQLVTDRMLNEDFPLAVLNEIEKRYSEIKSNQRNNANVNTIMHEAQRKQYIELIKNLEEQLKSKSLDVGTRTELEEAKEAYIKMAWQKQKKLIESKLGQKETIGTKAGDAESKKHAFSEDVKANKTGMNRIGYGKNKRNLELDKKLAELESTRQTADESGNLYASIMAYDEEIRLQKEHTKLKKVFPGLVISTGARQYSDIIREIDYRDDDLVKNVITIAILTSSIWTLAKNIQTRRALAEQEKLIETKNSEIIKANSENKILEAQGQKLVTGNQEMNNLATGDDVIAQGMARTSSIDGVSNYTASEIGALDKEGWVKAITDKKSNYYRTDGLRHNDTTFTDLQSQTDQIMSDFTTGKIEYTECVAELAKVSGKSQVEIVNTMQNALNSAKTYVSAMPGAIYDYTSYISLLKSSLQTAGATTEMMQRISDLVTKAVENAQLVSSSASIVNEIVKIEIDASIIPALLAVAAATENATRESNNGNTGHNKSGAKSLNKVSKKASGMERIE